MRSSVFSFSLACALAGAAFVAACGGASPPPEVPTAGSAEPHHADPPRTDLPKGDDKPKTDDKPKGDDKPKTDVAAGAKTMPDVTASKLGDELKAIGLDIGKLPKMAALKQQERVKVMTVLKKATGLDCKDCHADGDNKKETPMKQVARKMWDDWTVGMKLASGPLFCDSCHQGTHGFLDRKNKDATTAWMTTQLTAKLSKGGKAVGCDNCHTADIEMNIFEKVWKVKGAPHAMVPADDRVVVGLSAAD